MNQRARWLVFDPRTRCWWGPEGKGRYPDILNAGLFTVSETRNIQKVIKSDAFNVDKIISIDEYEKEIMRLYYALRRR